MAPPTPGGEHVVAVFEALLARRGHHETAQRRSISQAMSLGGGGLLIAFRDDALEVLRQRSASNHGSRVETRVPELGGTCAARHGRASRESMRRAAVA